MIVSPCIIICKTDPVTGYCYGCGRSNEDKKMWKDEEINGVKLRLQKIDGLPPKELRKLVDKGKKDLGEGEINL